MPGTSKKRSVGNNAFTPPARRSRSRNNWPLNANFDDLDDVFVNILEFLQLKEIMSNRRVSKKWGEAIKMVVPHGDFRVNSIEGYSFMGVMATALPNLQQITLTNLNLQQITLGNLNENIRHRNWHKYSDGEDPDEEYAAKTAHYTTHDIEIISNFSKLRFLTIKDDIICSSLLNGRYPFLFNSFPLLRKLEITFCYHLKFDLEMLAGLPMLRELYVSGQRVTGNMRNLRVLKDTLEMLTIGRCVDVEGYLMDLADFPHLKKLKFCDTAVKGDLRDIGDNDFSSLVHLSIISHSSLTGNIRSLRVLKDKLEKLAIASCANVEGNLMDLADFPLLKELNLYNTAVTGDVRDIGEDDFTNLEELRCPFGVVGGIGYKFEHIADVPSVVNAYYRLAMRGKSFSEYACSYCEWFLSDQSPDYYAAHEEVSIYFPHRISFVKVGSRIGWRWTNPQYLAHSCEINWLDPEPDRENGDYDAYAKELASIQEEINIYKGYHEPPTEEEYRRLCREYADN